jgi:hypothetical protein
VTDPAQTTVRDCLLPTLVELAIDIAERIDADGQLAQICISDEPIDPDRDLGGRATFDECEPREAAITIKQGLEDANGLAELHYEPERPRLTIKITTTANRFVTYQVGAKAGG